LLPGAYASVPFRFRNAAALTVPELRSAAWVFAVANAMLRALKSTVSVILAAVLKGIPKDFT